MMRASPRLFTPCTRIVPFSICLLQMEEGTAVKQTTSNQSMEAVLAQQIAENPQLVRGRLENGLEYVILPNETPPTRFEAHLEIHAGNSSELNL